MPDVATIIREKRKAKDPNFALLESVKDLRGLIEQVMKEKAEKSEERLMNILNEGIAEAERRLEAKIPDMEGVAEKIKGTPGKDSTVPGPKGDKGDTVIGPPGPKGDTVVGPPGPAGKTPKIDEKKIVTQVAKKFRQPKDGEPGKPGKDGSPDKPKQIAEKLNTMTAVVDMEVIKGLLKALRNLSLNIRQKGGGSGGGMGNWVHQAFSTSSATTSVVANTKVAAEGMAHLLRYQGQVQEYGTHYTVGSDFKTFTFLFTLQDDTNVSLTYVRT